MHNKISWRTRKGLSDDQLRRWRFAYDYAIKTTRYRCLLYAGDRTGSADLKNARTKKYYLRCVNKVLSSSKRSIKMLDGNKFSWSRILKKRALGRKSRSIGRIIHYGVKELCGRDKNCKLLNRKFARRSSQNLNSYQKKWWRLIYDYVVTVTALKCRMSQAYKKCVQETVKGGTKQSLIRTLDGRIYSWSNLLKMPSMLKPLSTTPKAVASTPQPTGRTSYRSPTGRAVIRVNREGLSRQTPREGRAVKLICDAKGCRTER